MYAARRERHGPRTRVSSACIVATFRMAPSSARAWRRHECRRYFSRKRIGYSCDQSSRCERVTLSGSSAALLPSHTCVHTYTTCRVRICRGIRGREAGRRGGTDGGRQAGTAGREGGREGEREAGRQGGREAGRQAGREGGRQGGRDGGTEGRRDGGTEVGREGVREGERTSPTWR